MAIAYARISKGKISLTVRYAALAAGDATKNMAVNKMPSILADIAPVANGKTRAAGMMPVSAYVPIIIRSGA